MIYALLSPLAWLVLMLLMSRIEQHLDEQQTRRVSSQPVREPRCSEVATQVGQPGTHAPERSGRGSLTPDLVN